MIRYLIKRILLFVPTLFVVSLLAFYISVNAPGDPVEILSQPANAQGANAALTATRQYKDSVRAQLGLNLPLFYFSLGTSNDCDTLYKVFDKQERYALYRLSRKYGNWELISDYHRALKEMSWRISQVDPDNIDRASAVFKDTSTIRIKNGQGVFQKKLKDSTLLHFYAAEQIQQEKNMALNLALSLPVLYSPEIILAKLDSLLKITRDKTYWSDLDETAAYSLRKFKQFQTNAGTGGNFVPKIIWYGTHNQYHYWLKELFRGNFGYSYLDQQPIAQKIWPKFLRSFTLVFLSVLLAYFIAILLGVYSAWGQGGFIDRAGSVFVFLLYSVPTFFAGTILLYFFANPEYFSWFPESGYCDPEHYNNNWPWWEKVYYTFPYMVLPLITYTYASFAFISRIMRSSVVNELGQDYIRTAMAKGLSSNRVLWKHATRNALLPVITTFVNIFPAAIAGSVIIETIFSYDGMGIATYEAVIGRDYPVIVCIFTLAGFMSMIAYFIADILYVLVDPRIRYQVRH